MEEKKKEREKESMIQSLIKPFILEQSSGWCNTDSCDIFVVTLISVGGEEEIASSDSMRLPNVLI